jgi:hypothetical protein
MERNSEENLKEVEKVVAMAETPVIKKKSRLVLKAPAPPTEPVEAPRFTGEKITLKIKKP